MASRRAPPATAISFRGKPIAVGAAATRHGGAIYLTKFASSVTVIHRRHTLRASKIMQDKALAHPKITSSGIRR
jgi:thioredoxin reductase (NADPH)